MTKQDKGTVEPIYATTEKKFVRLKKLFPLANIILTTKVKPKEGITSSLWDRGATDDRRRDKDKKSHN